MSKHTPGPWSWEDEYEWRRPNSDWKSENFKNGRIELTSTAGSVLKGWASYADDSGLDVTEANARLIAASPDLLEALELMLATVPPYREDGECTIPDTTIKVVNAAIKKATS